MNKKLHELMESRKAEMHEHAVKGKGHEVPETNFGDRKTTKDRMKGFRKNAISKLISKFKK